MVSEMIFQPPCLFYRASNYFWPFAFVLRLLGSKVDLSIDVIEIKSVAAFIYARFQTDLVSPIPDMTPSDAFSGNPVGGRLHLSFTDIKR